MNSREIGRAIEMSSARAAAATAATTRGVVKEVLEGGRVQVQLAGGGVIVSDLRATLNVTRGVGVVCAKNGQAWEVTDISVFQGGNGAPQGIDPTP